VRHTRQGERKMVLQNGKVEGAAVEGDQHLYAFQRLFEVSRVQVLPPYERTPTAVHAVDAHHGDVGVGGTTIGLDVQKGGAGTEPIVKPPVLHRGQDLAEVFCVPLIKEGLCPLYVLIEACLPLCRYALDLPQGHEVIPGVDPALP